MRILILDDNPYRHHVFDIRYKDHVVVHAYTYTQATRALDDSAFDLVHLDHDLGEFHTPDTYIGYDGKDIQYDGNDVAVHIAKNAIDCNVIIHSINPVGSRDILATLRNVGINVVWDLFKDDTDGTWVNDGV